MNLAAEVGSFSVSGNNTQLTYRKIEVQPAHIKAGFNLHYRFIDGYPTFVSSNAGVTNTAAMPSHQEHDLLVVMAVNFDDETIPVAPLNAGWTTVHTSSSTSGTKSEGIRIAYKFAKSNTELVGNWFTTDRIIVAVYRNARGFIGSAVEQNQSNSASIQYLSPDSEIIGTAGTRLLYFGLSHNSNNAGNTPSGTTSRITTASVPTATAPSIALHDATVDPNASSITGKTSAVSPGGKTIGITLAISYGTPPLTAETTQYATTLNGDVLARTVLLPSRGYRAELGNVLTTYRSFFSCQGGSFALTGSALDTHLGFYLQAENGELQYDVTNTFLQRALLLFPQTDSFSLAANGVDLPKGFFTTPQTGVFSLSVADAGATHAAKISADRHDLLASDVSAFLQRSIIEPLGGSSFSYSVSQAGVTNPTASPPGGGPARSPDIAHGGSVSTDPSFLRPRFVQYNSVSKSRDLGLVNNFLGTFEGEIGAQAGTQTLFFKITTRGDANLKIVQNPVNRFTDKQISIGILDANRKQIGINEFGFGFNNEITTTEEKESSNPLPGGTYYFTVSGSQWVKIPYSVSIQAIRFKELKGSVTLSAQPRARFAISKLIGAATLPAAFASTIPTNTQLKQPTGPILVSNGTRGTLVIPSGVATCRMLPTGRLKHTHKISGTASLSTANVATLSSAPSSGYGY